MNFITICQYVVGLCTTIIVVSSRDLRSNHVIGTSGHQQQEQEEKVVTHQKIENHQEDFVKKAKRCSSDVVLFVTVSSAVSHFQQRDAIRKTWGSYPGVEVQVVFLVGLQLPNETSADLQRYLDEESNTYQDIVQTPIVDSYANLTLKSVAMLKWTSIQCAHVPFVLKTDDDMYINIPVLLGDLRHSVYKRFFLGHIIAGARPIRDKTSKYFVPKTLYNRPMYPKYLSGTAYVISGDLISDLLKAANETASFVFEDVYVTGILARQVGSQHVYNGKFGYHVRTPDPCLFKIIITAHHMTAESLTEMWNKLSQPDLKCPYTRINVQD